MFATVHSLFERYGTPIVFVSALLEATLAFGMVFPGLIIMFLGGAAASQGDANIVTVFVAAVLGTVLGDTLSYTVGRWGGNRLDSTRFGPHLRLGAQLMSGKTRWFIPLYHLHNITRAVGPVGAGALRIPLWEWLPLDYLGAFIVNVLWVGGGYLFGSAVLTEDGTLEEHPAIRLGLAGAAVTYALVMQATFTRRLRQVREAEAAKQPVEVVSASAED